MAQIENGIRRVLSNGVVYDLLQAFMGAAKIRREFVRDYLKPAPGNYFMDIGCGTGDILSYLPLDINYFGFDASEEYIRRAEARFGVRGKFECAFVDSLVAQRLPAMDVVLAGGLIHHLDDHEVEGLLENAKKALKPGGRFVAIDPCFTEDQNIASKWLVSKDRGCNVRDQFGYQDLARSVFGSVESDVVHRTWVPYTHHIMVCYP